MGAPCTGTKRSRRRELMAAWLENFWPRDLPFPPALPWVAAAGLERRELMAMLMRIRAVTLSDGRPGLSVDGVTYDLDGVIQREEQLGLGGG